MEDEEAYEVIETWTEITDEARRSGCSGVGMFLNDMFELRNAYARVSVRFSKAPEDARIREYNGVKIILQELVDIPMNGRI
jgi:hypothetical protein